jgi:hypothetical protein
MGLFCVNFHFRNTDASALSAAMKRRGIAKHRVLPEKNGWTSLYDARASEQDEDRIRQLAGDLSNELSVPAIAFLVHDSDIACYWLFDRGRELDHFNSCPDYFSQDDDGPGAPPSGGQPRLLLPYGRGGLQEDQIAAILQSESLFAEDLIQKLAGVLGIERQRALADYKNVTEGPGPSAGGSDDDDGDDDDDDGSPGGAGLDLAALRQQAASRFAQMFADRSPNVSNDPEVAALVQAAAADDIETIDRLLQKGVAIDAEGPTPFPDSSKLGKAFPGTLPQLAMTPLLTAVANKRRRAVERLLAAKADPQHVHPLFGTPAHVAAGMGEADILKLLLDHGADLKARNGRGQTLLQVIAAARAAQDRMTQAQALMKSIKIQMPEASTKLAEHQLPTAGWDACERLLKDYGAV